MPGRSPPAARAEAENRSGGPSVTDPLNHTTSFTYNNANLVLTVTNALNKTTTYTYDDNGNLLTVTDANSNTTTYAYDEKDQLVSITDAEAGEWTFAYDEVGNLVSKTNPRGKTTTYTYDNLNRLLSETDPESNVRSYEYDLAGRLISRTNANSDTIEYTYSDRNQLTRIDYPDTSYVTFAYNDAGARTQMVDGTGTTSYSYDNLYRLTSVTFPGSRTVSYTYDDAGRRTLITYPSTDEVAYGYDAANRLTSVTDWNLDVTAYAYDDAGRMTSVTLPSATDIVSTYSYDDADRLLGIEHVQGGTTTLAFVEYTLDDVGSRVERVDDLGTHTYVYDDLYRLTSVTYPGPSTTTYAFDAFGNRTSMTEPGNQTTTYAYDDADRLESVTPPGQSAITYTWDANGSLTDRGSDTFEWDYEERLLEATVNSVTTTFAYRGDGLRDSRTVGQTTTTFTWDINAGLPVVLDDGGAQYVYGLGLVAQVDGNDSYYYLADGLGSTMVTVDSSGNVENSYAYNVYGSVTSSSGSQDNEFQFAGQQVDDSTGLQYLRARYYDSDAGRFVSREPLALLPLWRLNPYAYANAQPPNAVDPTGLAPEPGNGYRCTVGWCFVTALKFGWLYKGELFVITLKDGHWLERQATTTGGWEYQICFKAEKIGVTWCDPFDPELAVANYRHDLKKFGEIITTFVAIAAISLDAIGPKLAKCIDAHAIKKGEVGANYSRYDLKYEKGTGDIWIIPKGAKQEVARNTGYNLWRDFPECL